MLDHQLVYRQAGPRYQQLVDREDYQGNLLPALERIANPDGRDIYDLGAGTGRLACLLASRARSIRAFDLSPHMLEVAAARLEAGGWRNWSVAAADHRRIPCESSTADLVIAGWSLCYLVVWDADNWKSGLASGLQESKRLLRENGTLIIIETLGTGNTEPLVLEKLAGYFAYLEQEGFRRSWIRTDYRFQDRDEAQRLVEFFFGAEMLDHLSPDDQPILPECTGIWWQSPPG